jgi:hypothetical protein
MAARVGVVAMTSAGAGDSSVVVTDLRSRDRWMIAFNEVMPQIGGVTVLVLAIGNRIALHHNVKHRRCDPGYDTLAAEMKVSERTVMRAIKLIEDNGWLRRKRGGRDENVSFTLCFPNVTGVTEPEKSGPIPDNMLSPMERSSYLTKPASIGDTQGGSTNEQRNRDRSAASPRASVSSDTVGPVTPAEIARALSALEDHLPCNFDDNTQRAATKILGEMLKHGINMNHLHAEADQYCARLAVTGETPLPVASWLLQRRDGLTISSSH